MQSNLRRQPGWHLQSRLAWPNSISYGMRLHHSSSGSGQHHRPLLRGLRSPAEQRLHKRIFRGKHRTVGSTLTKTKIVCPNETLAQGTDINLTLTLLLQMSWPIQKSKSTNIFLGSSQTIKVDFGIICDTVNVTKSRHIIKKYISESDFSNLKHKLNNFRFETVPTVIHRCCQPSVATTCPPRSSLAEETSG
jgi:hypothetical protein